MLCFDSARPIPPGAEEIRLKVCKDKKRLLTQSGNAVCNAGKRRISVLMRAVRRVLATV